jgi:hypothetical protein
LPTGSAAPAGGWSRCKDILERMSTGYPASRLDDLLPWNWRPPTLLN